MQKMILILVFLTVNFVDAAIIIRTKVNKCLIHLEGEEAFPGDKFFALNLVGEKVGLIEIEKSKNGKAIGRILQGNAESNWILEKTSQVNPSLDFSQTSTVIHSQSLNNSVGFALNGIFINMIQSNIRGLNRVNYFNSFSGGGALFTNFKLSSSLMLLFQASGEYVQLRESQRNQMSGIGSRQFRDRRSSFLLWSFPLMLQYYIPMNFSQIKIWVGAGLSLDYWGGEFEQTYDILERQSTYHKLSNSAHIALGLDYYPPKTSFFIPIRLQGTSHFALDFIQRSVIGNEQTDLSFNKISIYIGIAQHI